MNSKASAGRSRRMELRYGDVIGYGCLWTGMHSCVTGKWQCAASRCFQVYRGYAGRCCTQTTANRKTLLVNRQPEHQLSPWREAVVRLWAVMCGLTTITLFRECSDCNLSSGLLDYCRISDCWVLAQVPRKFQDICTVNYYRDWSRLMTMTGYGWTWTGMHGYTQT
jgi:hypothetical protein